MKKHQDAKAQIHELIDRLSTNHILKNSSQSYVHDFVTARRLPDYLKTYEEMKQTIESGTSGIRFVLGKNRDLRMKDCLVLANEKFPPEAGVDDLNILFLSCGHFYRIAEWYMCLYRRGGLFGPEPFHPPESFARVDVVILSSLRYRHEHARAYPAWTLDGVLLLPIINTHGRSSRTSQAVREGLSGHAKLMPH